MKKGLLKRVCSILLVGSMVIGLSACSGSPEKAGAAPSGSSGSSDSNKPVKLSVYVNFTWFWNNKFEGIIPQEITKETGVTLDPTVTTDASQLGVMIASGDLPDLVYTDSMIDRLSNSDISYSWNDLIKSYTPDWKIDPTAEMVAKSYSTDGNFYTLLNASSTDEDWKNAKAGCPTLGSLYYRQDIVDAVGGPQINTLDDYLAVLAKVKQKYPDMLPLTMETTFMMDVFKGWLIPGWLPITSGMMQTDDNKIIHYTSSPQYEDFLKFMNNMYRKGYIKPDNFAYKDQNQTDDLVNNNKAFSYTFQTGDAAPGYTKACKENGSKDTLWVQAKPLVSDAKYCTVGTGWAGAFITKNNKDPKKSIQLMEWMFSDKGQRLTEWGREGIDYKLDSNGVPVFSQDWINSRDGKDFYTKYNPEWYFGINEVTEATGRASGISQNATDVMSEIRKNIHIETAPALVEPKGDSNDAVLLNQIETYVKNQEVKVILSKNDGEFNSNFSSMKSTLEKMGLQGLETRLTSAAKQFIQ